MPIQHWIEKDRRRIRAVISGDFAGWNVIQEQAEVYCYFPPTCDAGGPYQAECTGATGDTTIQLDGSGCSGAAT